MDWLFGSTTLNDAFGHLSYVLIATSYYLTRMFWLRVLAVLGLACEIVYFHFSGGDLSTGIAWNVVFIAINAYQLWRLVAQAREARHASELASLRQSLLAGLDASQIGCLLRTGSWRDVPPGARLTQEGVPVAELYLLASGRATVEVAHATVARLQAGSFVGEIAFLSGDPASATVSIEEPARVFVFDPARLRGLIRHDEGIAAAMLRALGQDLARKLCVSTHAGLGAVVPG